MIARLATLALFATLPASAAQIDLAKLLDAIQAVEGWHGHDGLAGERGPFQFTRAAWQETTSLPFALARNETISRAIAARRIRRIALGLERIKWESSPYELALIWNSGLTAVLRNRAKPAQISYARRVENLYYEKSHR